MSATATAAEPSSSAERARNGTGVWGAGAEANETSFSLTRNRDYQKLTSSDWPKAGKNLLPVRRTAADVAEDSDISGTLKKVGRFNKRQKFFVVKHVTVLLYYNGKEDTEPEGCIIADDLVATSAYQEEEADEDKKPDKAKHQEKKKRSTIVLKTSEKYEHEVDDEGGKSSRKHQTKFVLRANDDDTASKWISAFNSAVSGSPSGRRPKRHSSRSKFANAVHNVISGGHRGSSPSNDGGSPATSPPDEVVNELRRRLKEAVEINEQLERQKSYLAKMIRIMTDFISQSTRQTKRVYEELNLSLPSISEYQINALKGMLPQKTATKCVQLISFAKHLGDCLQKRDVIKSLVRRYLATVASDPSFRPSSFQGETPVVGDGAVKYVRFLSHILLDAGSTSSGNIEAVAKEVASSPSSGQEFLSNVGSILSTWSALFPTSMGLIIRSVADCLDVFEHSNNEKNAPSCASSNFRSINASAGTQFWENLLKHRKVEPAPSKDETLPQSNTDNMISTLASAVLINDELPSYPLETLLKDYFSLYDPHKVRKVPEILKKYDYDERKVIAAVERRYRRPVRVPYLPLKQLPFAPGILMRPHWNKHHWQQFFNVYGDDGSPDNTDNGFDEVYQQEEEDDDDDSFTLDFGEGVKIELNLSEDDRKDEDLDTSKVDKVAPVPHMGENDGWLPDESTDRCNVCDRDFSVSLRKHHCRACGRLVCADCSSTQRALPEFGYWSAVRQCDECVVLL